MVPMMKQAPLLLLSLTLATIRIEASLVTLDIAPGGKFDVNYQLSTGPSTSAVLNISGNILVDLEITGGEISKFLFRGGNVAYSDTTSDITVSTFPVTAKVRLLTRGIVSSAASNSGAGGIDSLSGIISNTGHRLIQDRGTVTTRYIVGSTTLQEDIRNLDSEPDNSPLVGVTTVTGALLANLDYKAFYRINFEHTRDETRVQPAEVISGSVSIREVGGFTATREVWLPGPAYVNWALTYLNQRPNDFSDRSPASGQPLVLLYAFGATNEFWSPPLTFEPEDGQVILDLPESGLQAPVRVEYSATLKEGEWVPLSKSDESPAVFNVGEYGPVLINLPSGDKGFIRLALAD